MTNPPEETGATSRPVRARLEKFADLDAFIAGYSQYFFEGGMLLPTRNPREIGSRIHLQLEIRGGVVVVRADGVVERIRNAPDGSPVGMVVRFESTDADTSALIQRILAERRTRRTSDHPAVAAAPEVAAPAARQPSAEPVVAASPAPAQAAAPAPATPATADADEALNAIADSLDESFDAIFGGGDRISGSRPAVGFTPAPEPVRAAAASGHEAPASRLTEPERAATGFSAAPAPAAPAPAAPAPAPAPAAPAPAVPRGTMVGMPAFDVAAFLEQKAANEAAEAAASPAEAEESESADILQPETAASVEAATSEPASDAPDEQGVDPRASQPLGRLALQRVAKGPDTRPMQAVVPEPPASSARSILRGITGEMAAVPADLDEASHDAGQDAVDRLLHVQPAPIPERSSENVLDDLLGDLSASPAPRTQAMSAAPEPVLGDEPLAPVKQAQPQGFIARLLAFLRSLFA